MEKNSVYGNPLVYKIPEENSKKACRCLFERLCGHVPARVVLYFLSWSGFLVSFMMRTDINLAIVAMVHLPTPSALSTVNVTDEETYCYDAETLADHNSTTNYYEDGEFDWSNTVQSVVLGSFYWSYIVSQVVGGLATQRFGTKRVFGWAQLATAACSLAIPSAAVTHWSLLVVLRCAQGFASGLTWPAMYAVVGHWIPTAERSRFMSSFQGFSIGIGVTYPLCGFLIAHFGWRSVFYTTGSIGVLWCIVWYLLAFDSPESHPRISNQEKQYIADNTVNTLAASRLQVVPWRSIFTSIPAWSIGITTFGRIWVHYTFIIPGPMYMKTVLGFSIQENGLLSGAPFISSYLASVVFCWVADQWVTKKVFSLTNVRKIFTALSQVVPGILCILIGYMGCNLILVLIFWFIAVTLITAAYAGAMANIVDLSPNFAGPVLAFAQTIHMTASFCSPLAAGFLTRDGHTLAAWRNVFGTTAFVAIGTYVMYQIFGTGDVQPWNNPKMIVDPEEESTETEKMINGGTNTDTKTTNI